MPGVRRGAVRVRRRIGVGLFLSVLVLTWRPGIDTPAMSEPMGRACVEDELALVIDGQRWACVHVDVFDPEARP